MPNEVPAEFTTSAIDFPLRRTYEGMAHCMDSGIGNITDALRKTGRFNTTLIVFSAEYAATDAAARAVPLTYLSSCLQQRWAGRRHLWW